VAFAVILILMTSRSGSSLVAKIFAAHGFDTGGKRVHSCGYETFENAAVNQWIRDHKPLLKLTTGEFCDFVPGIGTCIPDSGVVKIGVEYLTLFEQLDPMVITVKRNAGAVAKSLATKRGHPEQADGCYPSILLRYRALDLARERWNGAEINTDEIMAGDLTKVEAAFGHFGLDWDEAKTLACIDPDKWHKW
jgi:hypothetical protein